MVDRHHFSECSENTCLSHNVSDFKMREPTGKNKTDLLGTKKKYFKHCEWQQGCEGL